MAGRPEATAAKARSKPVQEKADAVCKECGNTEFFASENDVMLCTVCQSVQTSSRMEVEDEIEALSSQKKGFIMKEVLTAEEKEAFLKQRSTQMRREVQLRQDYEIHVQALIQSSKLARWTEVECIFLHMAYAVSAVLGAQESFVEYAKKLWVSVCRIYMEIEDAAQEQVSAMTSGHKLLPMLPLNESVIFALLWIAAVNSKWPVMPSDLTAWLHRGVLQPFCEDLARALDIGYVRPQQARTDRTVDFQSIDRAAEFLVQHGLPFEEPSAQELLYRILLATLGEGNSKDVESVLKLGRRYVTLVQTSQVPFFMQVLTPGTSCYADQRQANAFGLCWRGYRSEMLASVCALVAMRVFRAKSGVETMFTDTGKKRRRNNMWKGQPEAENAAWPTWYWWIRRHRLKDGGWGLRFNKRKRPCFKRNKVRELGTKLWQLLDPKSEERVLLRKMQKAAKNKKRLEEPQPPTSPQETFAAPQDDTPSDWQQNIEHCETEMARVHQKLTDALKKRKEHGKHPHRGKAVERYKDALSMLATRLSQLKLWAACGLPLPEENVDTSGSHYSNTLRGTSLRQALWSLVDSDKLRLTERIGYIRELQVKSEKEQPSIFSRSQEAVQQLPEDAAESENCDSARPVLECTFEVLSKRVATFVAGLNVSNKQIRELQAALIIQTEGMRSQVLIVAERTQRLSREGGRGKPLVPDDPHAARLSRTQMAAVRRNMEFKLLRQRRRKHLGSWNSWFCKLKSTVYKRKTNC